jgi:hypothetical protein
MRCAASVAMSAEPTTRRIGSVARSSSRRASIWSPRIAAESDETCGDQVHADGREFEREARSHGRQRGIERRNERESCPARREPVPPMKSRVPPGRTLPTA